MMAEGRTPEDLFDSLGDIQIHSPDHHRRNRIVAGLETSSGIWIDGGRFG